MQSKASTVSEYLEELPEERKEAFITLRNVILENIWEGFEEMMSYWMIGYVVPHSRYPEGYHCTPEFPLPFINIGNQKNFIALYNCWMYADNDIYNWFVDEYPKHCKYKLDMWKSCVRFKKLDDIPYGLIWELVSKISVEKRIETYEKAIKR